jgi:prepilin peptidase CpaA
MTLAQILALAVAVVACITDVHSRRIPNVLTFGAALAALGVGAAIGGFTGATSALAGWVVGLAVFFVPFALRGLGAGDVKLMAALGAWLGPADALWLGVYTALAGGVVALFVAIARGYLRTALSNVWLLLTHWRARGLRALPEITLEGSGGPRLAYAVPIFCGLVMTLWLR